MEEKAEYEIAPGPLGEAELNAIEQTHRHAMHSFETLYAALNTIPRLIAETRRMVDEYKRDYPAKVDPFEGQ